MPSSQHLETTPPPPKKKAGVPQQRSGCEAQIVLRGGQSPSMEAVRDPATQSGGGGDGWMGNDSCQCLPVMQVQRRGEPTYMALLRRRGAPIRATRTGGRGAVAAASVQRWRVLPEQGSRQQYPTITPASRMHALAFACRLMSYLTRLIEAFFPDRAGRGRLIDSVVVNGCSP
jgi:hypothetical protein